MLSRFLQSLIGLLLVISLSGCAHRPKVNWNSRIGQYTYDQAVVELGPPDKSASLKDGSVVAEWLTSRGYNRRDYFFYPRSRYDFYHYHYSGHPAPDQFLRLTFAPDGHLHSWKPILR